FFCRCASDIFVQKLKRRPRRSARASSAAITCEHATPPLIAQGQVQRAWIVPSESYSTVTIWLAAGFDALSTTIVVLFRGVACISRAFSCRILMCLGFIACLI